MMKFHKKIRVPIVVTQLKKNKYEAYIPDFNVSVYGFDYVSIIANAITVASALYFFYLERNIDFELDTTLEDADAIAMSKKKSFATTIALLA